MGTPNSKVRSSIETTSQEGRFWFSIYYETYAVHMAYVDNVEIIRASPTYQEISTRNIMLFKRMKHRFRPGP